MDLKSLKIDRRTKKGRGPRRSAWPLRIGLLATLAVALWFFWVPLRNAFDRISLPEVQSHLVTEASSSSAAAVSGTAANGYVVAARRAALSSDVPGRIVELSVREGSVVKKGDVVARLYSDEYRAALARTEAELATAGASIVRAESQVAEREAEQAEAKNAEATAAARADEASAQAVLAETEHSRQTELVASGIGQPRDLERARAELDASQARLVAARSGLAMSRLTTTSAGRRLATAREDVALAKARRDAAVAARDLAKATLDKTDVRAPFDGVVVLKDAEIGEVVSPNVVGGSSARGAVCTMVDFASLEVQAHVPETSLSAVALGAPVDVFLDAWPDERLNGRVDRIWPTADRTKATVEVRIVVDERERLRPEYGVRVVFHDAEAARPVEAAVSGARRILVPETSIVEIDAVPHVFVIERDTVRAQPVEAGERKGGRAVIEAGLRPGLRIVAEPPPSLRDGDRVRIASL